MEAKQTKPDAGWKRERVLAALQSDANPHTIYALALNCFPGMRPIERGERQVLNALRGLVAVGLARQVGRGTYEASGDALPESMADA